MTVQSLFTKFIAETACKQQSKLKGCIKIVELKVDNF